MNNKKRNFSQKRDFSLPKTFDNESPFIKNKSKKLEEFLPSIYNIDNDNESEEDLDGANEVKKKTQYYYEKIYRQLITSVENEIKQIETEISHINYTNKKNIMENIQQLRRNLATTNNNFITYIKEYKGSIKQNLKELSRLYNEINEEYEKIVETKEDNKKIMNYLSSEINELNYKVRNYYFIILLFLYFN